MMDVIRVTSTNVMRYITMDEGRDRETKDINDDLIINVKM